MTGLVTSPPSSPPSLAPSPPPSLTFLNHTLRAPFDGDFRAVNFRVMQLLHGLGERGRE